jgi:hypothetical protein
VASVGESVADSARGANLGWVAGALVILAVFVVGAVFWFSYHHP